MEDTFCLNSKALDRMYYVTVLFAHLQKKLPGTRRSCVGKCLPYVAGSSTSIFNLFAVFADAQECTNLEIRKSPISMLIGYKEGGAEIFPSSLNV